MTDLDFPIPDVPASNARHDQEHGEPGRLIYNPR